MRVVCANVIHLPCFVCTLKNNVSWLLTFTDKSYIDMHTTCPWYWFNSATPPTKQRMLNRAPVRTSIQGCQLISMATRRFRANFASNCLLLLERGCKRGCDSRWPGACCGLSTSSKKRNRFVSFVCLALQASDHVLATQLNRSGSKRNV